MYESLLPKQQQKIEEYFVLYFHESMNEAPALYNLFNINSW